MSKQPGWELSWREPTVTGMDQCGRQQRQRRIYCAPTQPQCRLACYIASHRLVSDLLSTSPLIACSGMRRLTARTSLNFTKLKVRMYQLSAPKARKTEQQLASEQTLLHLLCSAYANKQNLLRRTVCASVAPASLLSAVFKLCRAPPDACRMPCWS